MQHLKAISSSGDVHSCEVTHIPILGIGVVTQKCQNRDYSIGMNHDLQLIKASHLKHMSSLHKSHIVN